MRRSLKKKRDETHFQTTYDELTSCVQAEKEGETERYYSWIRIISAYETYSKLKKEVMTIPDDYRSKYEITFS